MTPDDINTAGACGSGGCSSGGCIGGQDDRCQSCTRGSCQGCSCSTRRDEPRGKFQAWDWLRDVPGSMAQTTDMVEVQFKNTRRGFYRNTTHIPLAIGDWVAVEASPGHDIGQVTMTGNLVTHQMNRLKGADRKDLADGRRVFRRARPGDLEKYDEVRAREHATMIAARRIASDLHLNMKIGDVEYQGDGSKAIFYYISEGRVDFRQLIKVLADRFKVRVEMRQIGARQEAGRIGAVGPCGRPLCCSTWMRGFVSVSTGAARIQDLSLNPQKLAGQCAKLKCCLNYEVDDYLESSRRLPPRDAVLETAEHSYHYFKADILAQTVTYSTERNSASGLVTIPAARALEVIALNAAGEKPDTLDGKAKAKKPAPVPYGDLLADGDAINRFDKKKKKRKRKPAAPAQDQQQPQQPQASSQQPKTSPQQQRRRAPKPPRSNGQQ